MGEQTQFFDAKLDRARSSGKNDTIVFNRMAFSTTRTVAPFSASSHQSSAREMSVLKERILTKTAIYNVVKLAIHEKEPPQGSLLLHDIMLKKSSPVSGPRRNPKSIEREENEKI